MNNVLIINGALKFENYVALDKLLHNPQIIEIDITITYYIILKILVIARRYKVTHILINEYMKSTYLISFIKKVKHLHIDILFHNNNKLIKL